MIYGNDTAIVMDIDQWKDYSGEQIQLCTKDDFVLLTSSFDTSCFYGTSDKYNASILANNGTISDEVSYVGDWKSETDFNYDVFDTNWDYNKSITFNGDNAVILPVKEWKDYQGEQLQIKFNDDTGILTTFVNTCLLDK